MLQTNTMISIIKSPLPEHQEFIESWLKSEYEERQEGFYVNWHMIQPCFMRNEVHCLTIGNLAIAFGLFTLSQISIMAVHPSYRNLGYGSALAKHLLKFLKSRGATHIRIQCAPEASASFWETIGFVNLETEGRNKYMQHFLHGID